MIVVKWCIAPIPSPQTKTWNLCLNLLKVVSSKMLPTIKAKGFMMVVSSNANALDLVTWFAFHGALQPPLLLVKIATHSRMPLIHVVTSLFVMIQSWNLRKMWTKKRRSQESSTAHQEELDAFIKAKSTSLEKSFMKDVTNFAFALMMERPSAAQSGIYDVLLISFGIFWANIYSKLIKKWP